MDCGDDDVEEYGDDDCDEDDFVGVLLGEEARARRHGRPLLVRPRQVLCGFLESERERRDSGVCPVYGIVLVMSLGYRCWLRW